jgi:hypothetical protein
MNRCTAVTVWLFTDRYPTSSEALFRRDDYAPKPACFGVRRALHGPRGGK